MPEETLQDSINNSESEQLERTDSVRESSMGSGYLVQNGNSIGNQLQPGPFGGSTNFNKGWNVNIDKLHFGYILNIGCKSMALVNYSQVISVLTNYYKFIDENPQENLESIFNSLKNESERMEFLKL